MYFNSIVFMFFFFFILHRVVYFLYKYHLLHIVACLSFSIILIAAAHMYVHVSLHTLTAVYVYMTLELIIGLEGAIYLSNATNTRHHIGIINKCFMYSCRSRPQWTPYKVFPFLFFLWAILFPIFFFSCSRIKKKLYIGNHNNNVWEA